VRGHRTIGIDEYEKITLCILHARVACCARAQVLLAFVSEIKSGILGFYIRVGYRMIPRFSLYLIIFLVGLSCFAFVAIQRGDSFILDPFNWLILLILITGIFAFISESIRMWRIKPQ